MGPLVESLPLKPDSLMGFCASTSCEPKGSVQFANVPSVHSLTVWVPAHPVEQPGYGLVAPPQRTLSPTWIVAVWTTPPRKDELQNHLLPTAMSTVPWEAWAGPGGATPRPRSTTARPATTTAEGATAASTGHLGFL